MKRLGYLTGPAAVDVAAVLDIPTETSRGRYGEPVRYLDLDRMDAWLRFRAVWILVAGEAVLQSADAPATDGDRPAGGRDSAAGTHLAESRRVAHSISCECGCWSPS